MMSRGDTATGATLGGGAYIVGERLHGAGAAGIYRGYHRWSHPSRSLLVTVCERADRPLAELAQRLQLEVPGVAPLLHAGSVTGGREGVVEEEPGGRPLSTAALPLRPDTVAIVVRQIAAVLAAVHRSGAALGGLQPELIYARPAACGPILTGLAPRAAIVAPAAPLFAHVYAPEQDGWDPAADVFSLCAMASHWLCGHHPFRGLRAVAQREAIARGHRRPWRGPRAWGDLIARGLSRDGAERPDLLELVAALESI